MVESERTIRFRFWLWLIRFVGVLVPRRLRADWRQEWESELRYREMMLADWDRLDLRNKVDLLWRSTSAFWDALWLQPRRLEDEMFQDLRYGVRMLLKNRGFSAVVVVTLALGIGANAALFSVVNGVLLNPLPFPQPEQLVTLHQSKPNFDTGAIPYPNFRDWQKENQTFSMMAIARGFGFNLTGTGEPQRINTRLVSADYFSVLGIEFELGRNFAASEDAPGADPVAIISAGLWQRKFGSAPDLVGKSMTLDDKNYTIIGVLPKSFSLTAADLFVTIGHWNGPALQNRGAALGLHGIGRLKPGVTIEQAQADMDRVSRNLADAYPSTNKGNGAKLIPMKERVVGDIGPILLMLFGAVGFVLLIACVNVSNLMLARSTVRTREFAIRSALGAGQWRLLRQSLTESTLLALAGGGLGLAVAAWGTQAALSALPTGLPRAAEVGLDARVVAFTFVVSLLTGLLSGLAPALKTTQWRLSETLKEAGRGAGGGRHRAQGVMVAVEMALALVLLIGAGLMIRSMASLWKVDPGFIPDNLLTFELSLPPSLTTGQTANPNAIRTAHRDLNERLGSIPGVKAVSFTEGGGPLQGVNDLRFWREDRLKPATASDMDGAFVYVVEPDYLTAMGIPLKRGRFFTAQDDQRAPNVAVIDEVFARKHFPGEEPIGKRINLGQEGDPWQIVGVVGHVRQWSIDSEDEKQSLQSQLYLSFRAASDDGLPSNMGVVIRADGAVEAGPAMTPLMASVRRAIQSQHSQNVISRLQTMNDVIAASLAERRFAMILLEAFAVVALLLASMGLYGVISYVVGQRTHELGIRLALGAQRRDVLGLVVGHGMKMSLGGVALGLTAAFGLTRLLVGMLHGVSPTDPITFVAITLVLTLVALLACFFPARRATKVDPLVALRHE